MRRLLAAVALAVVVALAGGAPAAWAHEDGKVELFVGEFHVTASATQYEIEALVVDRDSGTPASGFSATVTGVGPGGATFGPVSLDDVGGGEYVTSATGLVAGPWTFTVSAAQGPSATPALASQRQFPLTLEAIAPAQTTAPTTPTTTTAPPTTLPATTAPPTTLPTTTLPAGAVGELRLTVALDPDRQTALLSSNYVAIVARVTDAATGQPVPTVFTLIAGIRDEAGVPDATTFHMAYPYAADQREEPGRYTGVVIVPRGGVWTIAVNVFDPYEERTQKIPTPLAVGLVVTDVEAGTLEGLGRKESVQGADVGEVLWRLLHSLVGLAWFGLAGVLLMAAWPGRAGLTGRLGEAIERNVRRISTALMWVTLVMWVSGIINLNTAVAFDPPLSSKQATQLFRVPYARIYISVLYTKIAIYAVLTGLSIPLVRRSRAMAESTAADAPQRKGRHAVLSTAIVVGGVAILVCVTVMTALHVLSERTAIRS